MTTDIIIASAASENCGRGSQRDNHIRSLAAVGSFVWSVCLF
jgi:hypothetical protein